MALSEETLRAYATSEDAVITALAVEVLRLRAGIQNHRSSTGHGLCWLNDVELWRLLDPEASYPHETVPVREEFLAQCQRFYESRLQGTPYAEPAPKQTVSGDRNI